MKKICLHDYIDIKNNRGQEFGRTKNDIMPESVLVSGDYVDTGSETIKDGNPVIEREPITECTVEDLSNRSKLQIHYYKEQPEKSQTLLTHFYEQQSICIAGARTNGDVEQGVKSVRNSISSSCQ